VEKMQLVAEKFMNQQMGFSAPFYLKKEATFGLLLLSWHVDPI